MSGEICTDDRFEIIAAYKKKLVECTNIETRPKEMAVIDDILFRFWQMGWLPSIPHGKLIDANTLYEDCALDRGYQVMATTTRINEYMQLKIDDAPTVIAEEVYGQYTDTAGNYHWCGTQSGEHITKAEEDET